jgi:hypothetical protein
VQFPVAIGFDTLLLLQGFNLLPNGIFGDLAMIIKVIPNALVWVCTDPRLYIGDLSSTTVTTASQNTILNCRLAYNNIVPATAFSYYDHRFTQTRVQDLARSNLTVNLQDGNYMSLFYCAPLRIDPDTCTTTDAVSAIPGFSLKDTVKRALAEYYTTVLYVIPSERIFVQAFSTGPTESGLNCAMNIPLNNAKEIIALFPRNANELTVFRNPICNHLMLTLLN